MHPAPRSIRRLFAAAVAALACIANTAGAVDIIFVSDLDNGHPIQWVRHHDVSAGGVSIALGPARVTALQPLNSGQYLTAYLQVPPGLNTSALYPWYSALKTYGLMPVPGPFVGQCVRVEGTITQFKGATEIGGATFTALADTDCAQSDVNPWAVTAAEIATDTDTVTFGYQTGPEDEALESVLLQMSSVYVIAGNDGNGDFPIKDNTTNGYVLVADGLYHYTATQGTVLNVVRGVYDEADNINGTLYQLLPRNGADIVQ